MTTPEKTTTTKHVAAKFGLKPVQLRRILRSMPQYADGVHTNYRWAGLGDPAIALIAKAIEASKARKASAKIAAQAALAKAKKAASAKSVADKVAEAAAAKAEAEAKVKAAAPAS